MVLQKSLTFSCAIHDNPQLRLAGMIYLQRISDTRMSSSSLKSLRIFEKLCEDRIKPPQRYSCHNDVETSPNRRCAAEWSRKTELSAKHSRIFWNLVSGGAIMTKYYDNYESALDVVEPIAKMNKEIILKVRREMLERGTLVHTTIGRFFNDTQRIRERYERELAELQEALEEAIRDQDNDPASTISEQRRDYKERM